VGKKTNHSSKKEGKRVPERFGVTLRIESVHWTFAKKRDQTQGPEARGKSKKKTEKGRRDLEGSQKKKGGSWLRKNALGKMKIVSPGWGGKKKKN